MKYPYEHEKTLLMYAAVLYILCAFISGTFTPFYMKEWLKITASTIFLFMVGVTLINKRQ